MLSGEGSAELLGRHPLGGGRELGLVALGAGRGGHGVGGVGQGLVAGVGRLEGVEVQADLAHVLGALADL